MNTTNLAMNISAHSTLGLPIGPGDTGRVPDNTVASVLWAKLVSKWDETTKPLNYHPLLFSFILNYDQAFRSWWVMLFGPGGSLLIMAHFPGNLRVGVGLDKPSSTEVAVTLVRWEVVRPGLPLSYQLQLRYAQAISCDKEGVMPAMDVGMGARPPLQRRSVQVAPSQLQRGGPRDDMLMKTEVHEVILRIWNRTSLEETTDRLLLDTWYSSPPDIPALRYQQLSEADRAVMTYTCWKTGTFVSPQEQLRFREIKNIARQSLHVLF